MRKAYDTFLQAEVSSNLAAKSGGLEPYRYECAHCGEEVRLAAMGSIRMAPHFRHRSGNNDVECEKYLGQFGSISLDASSRKSKNERIEFYFDNSTRMFYLGVCFSSEEIMAYEQEKAFFELKTLSHEHAFLPLSINNRNFDSDAPRMIPIEKFSYNYFASNSFTGIRRKYELFKRNDNNIPTFFKIQGNDNCFKAKLVRSTILYTDVPYFVVFPNQSIVSKNASFPNDMIVDDTFQFNTMDRSFLGHVILIKEKTVSIDAIIASWGYQLEASETLILLWPPAIQVDETSIVYSNYAFLFSSFELEANGNINIHSDKIKKLEKGISMVSSKSKVKVYRKNAEITICKGKQDYATFDALPIIERQQNVYTVPDNSMHFLFNRSGVSPIYHGQSVLLTPDSSIRYYRYGYLEGVVYPLQYQKLIGEQLLSDLLVHYKRVEDFSIETFESLDLSEVALQYINKCDQLGKINSAAKYFIKEGRL